MNKYRKAFERLNAQLRRNSNETGCSLWGLYVNAASCFLRYGITPNEYLGWNCWKLSKRVLKEFYTARDSSLCEPRFNNPKFAHFYDNKVDFNKMFCAFVKRAWVYTAESSPQEVEEFIKSHPKVIVKPIGLSSGHGIYCIDTVSWGG